MRSPFVLPCLPSVAVLLAVATLGYVVCMLTYGHEPRHRPQALIR